MTVIQQYKLENKREIISVFIFLSILVGCSFFKNHKDIELPILSPKVNGSYAVINSFEFKNQYNQIITQNHTKGKVYVAEFFFTNCPSICPLVSKQLQGVYKRYKDEVNFMILSHTIDPEHDIPSELMKYYTNTLQIEQPSNWHLLTGNKDKIYDLANFSYGTVVYKGNNKLKNNIMHSGALLLIDQNRLIRGMYDGKDPESINRLITDIGRLLRHFQ